MALSAVVASAATVSAWLAGPVLKAGLSAVSTVACDATTAATLAPRAGSRVAIPRMATKPQRGVLVARRKSPPLEYISPLPPEETYDSKSVDSHTTSYTSAQLLTPDEEKTLATTSQKGSSLRVARRTLKKRLQRTPTTQEWAEAVGTTVKELRNRLARASRAREHLCAANGRLVMTIAKSYLPNSALAMEDLIQEGQIGLLKAVERFDPKRGFRFSTFASWWIRAAISAAVADKSRAIRLPRGQFHLLARAKKTREQMLVELGRQPTERELAAALQVTSSSLRSLMSHWHTTRSLEAPLRSSISSTGKGTLLDSARCTPLRGPRLSGLDAIDRSLVAEVLARQLDTALSPLDSKVLRLRYGMGSDEGLSWREISERCGHGGEVRLVRAAQDRAFRRLRRTHEVIQLCQQD